MKKTSLLLFAKEIKCFAQKVISILLISAGSLSTPLLATPLEVAYYEAGYLYSKGVGIDKDVITEVSKRSGFTFTETEKPRARIWKELADGVLPMSVSGIQNANRDEFAWFVPYISQKNKAIVVNPKYKTADLFLADKEAKIAVVRGFKHADFDPIVNELVAAGGRVTEVPTIHNLFLMLNAGGRVDMIISLPVFYSKELKELNMMSKVTVLGAVRKRSRGEWRPFEADDRRTPRVG